MLIQAVWKKRKQQKGYDKLVAAVKIYFGIDINCCQYIRAKVPCSTGWKFGTVINWMIIKSLIVWFDSVQNVLGTEKS